MIKKYTKFILSLILIISLFIPNTVLTANCKSSLIENNGIYYIKNRRTGKYLTAAGTTANSNVFQGNFTGSTLQQFKLVRREISPYAYYNIVSVANTSLRLDVHNAYDTNGTNIKLFTETTYTGAQNFRFYQTYSNTIGSYRIMPQLSTTKVLSITGNSLLDNANVELYTDSSSNLYQDWVLEKVSSVEIANVTPITIYNQETGSTCGPACARMILAQHGVTVTEDAIVRQAQWEYDNSNNRALGYTFVFALVKTINHFLSENNINVRYEYYLFEDVGTDVYELLFALAAENNVPIQIPIDNDSGTNTGLPYRTDGHYVVVTGIKYDSSDSESYICVSDPYKTTSNEYAGIWEIPVAELYNFSQRHSAFFIMQNTE